MLANDSGEYDYFRFKKGLGRTTRYDRENAGVSEQLPEIEESANRSENLGGQEEHFFGLYAKNELQKSKPQTAIASPGFLNKTSSKLNFTESVNGAKTGVQTANSLTATKLILDGVTW